MTKAVSAEQSFLLRSGFISIAIACIIQLQVVRMRDGYVQTQRQEKEQYIHVYPGVGVLHSYA